MAKLIVGTGIETYLGQLTNLEFQSPHIAGRAVYEGAKIVTDAVRSGIQGLPVQDTDYRGKARPGMVRGVTATQKQGLLDGLGIATMRCEGSFWNVKTGMDGYNSNRTRKYPNGQPNAMIARSIESGTSFRQKTPFIAPAVRKTKAAAEAKMAQICNEEISKIMN